jgi:hypothetical protein
MVMFHFSYALRLSYITTTTDIILLSSSFYLDITTDILYLTIMTTNKPKLLFVIPQELLTRIDDFRFNNRINSRSEAVRKLIDAGLNVSGSSKAKAKKK